MQVYVRHWLQHEQLLQADWANRKTWHAGGSQGAPDSQLAAELAQQMSDQARAQAAMSQGQPHMAGHQQGAVQYPTSRAVHLFAGIANWLSRLNEAGSSRSWPNIDLPYPISSQSKALSPSDQGHGGSRHSRHGVTLGSQYFAQACPQWYWAQITHPYTNGRGHE